jgi:sodium transport system permease protein
MIVYLLLMVLFMGGSAFAIDQVAGEKERGTLETLFLIPARRESIARSKLIYVAIGTAITGTLTMVGLFITYRLGWMQSDTGLEGLRLSVPATIMALTLVVPLAVLVGSILLAISTVARTIKDAQTYQLPMLLVMFIPALMAMSQSIELNAALAVVPIANVAFAMRDVLLGQMNWPLHVTVVLSTLVWAGLALRWVGSLMSREEMVLGFDPEPFLARTRTGRLRAVHVAMALTLLVFFYVGNLVQTKLLLKGVALTFWVLLPALTLFVSRLAWSGGHVRDVLSLRAPRPLALLGALCLALGVMLPIAGGLTALQAKFLPAPTYQFDSMEKMFVDASNWRLAFLMALSPAIWEELLFRGVCLGLLLRVTGRAPAIVISAAYFGIIHLSVFRLAPTFVLGVILATLVVRTRSLLPAMLFHFVYNGALLLGSRYVEQGGSLPLDPDGALAWGLSVVLLVAGAQLVRSARPSADA